MSDEAAPDPQFVKAVDVRRIFGGVSDTFLKTMIDRGILPPPIRLCRDRFWPIEDVDDAVRKFRKLERK